MGEDCMDDSALNIRSAALKKLIKDLMLLDNPKRGEEPALEVKSVSVGGEDVPEEEGEALSELIEKKDEHEQEDDEDIVNYKRV